MYCNYDQLTRSRLAWADYCQVVIRHLHGIQTQVGKTMKWIWDSTHRCLIDHMSTKELKTLTVSRWQERDSERGCRVWTIDQY